MSLGTRTIKGKKYRVLIVDGEVHYATTGELKRARKRYKKLEKEVHWRKYFESKRKRRR